MFEITMLAGFLIAGISQLIPEPKKPSKPIVGATSSRKSPRKRQSEAKQPVRRQCISNSFRTYRPVKAA